MDLLNWKRFVCVLKDFLVRAILQVVPGNMNFKKSQICRLSLAEESGVVTLRYQKEW